MTELPPNYLIDSTYNDPAMNGLRFELTKLEIEAVGIDMRLELAKGLRQTPQQAQIRDTIATEARHGYIP